MTWVRILLWSMFTITVGAAVAEVGGRVFAIGGYVVAGLAALLWTWRGLGTELIIRPDGVEVADLRGRSGFAASEVEAVVTFSSLLYGSRAGPLLAFRLHDGSKRMIVASFAKGPRAEIDGALRGWCRANEVRINFVLSPPKGRRGRVWSTISPDPYY